MLKEVNLSCRNPNRQGFPQISTYFRSSQLDHQTDESSIERTDSQVRQSQLLKELKNSQTTPDDSIRTMLKTYGN